MSCSCTRAWAGSERTASGPARDHDLSGFDCGNEELNRWLVEHARASQKADLARTYALLLDATGVGYVSLTTGSVRRETAPKLSARGMPRHPIRRS